LTNVDFSELDALDLCKSTLNCISALAVEPPANVLPWSEPAHVAACRRAYDAESEVQCHLLRDIFGNLFRPGKLARTWLTANVAAISQMIYDDRHFSDLPILADALDDAGCHDADILAHCRQPGPHVRGCWVVDAVLGRA